MRVRIPLLLKILAPLALLLILTVAISGYRVYQESTQNFQIEMDTRLERAAILVAGNAPTQTLQSIAKPTDVLSPTYASIARSLEQAQTAGGLNWIGIYYMESEHFYYWVDVSETGVGYPFFYATPEHYAAYEDMQPHRVQYADEFGSYYGFVAPIVVQDEDGSEHVLGLVEAVIDGESAQLLERDALNRILPILIGGSGVAVLITVLVAIIAFNRPLQKLEHGALAIARGEFGHTIDLYTHDELGDLAATFNQVSAQIEHLTAERVEMERRRRQEEIERLQESERTLEAKVTERTAELVQKNEELTRAQAELASARDQAVEANQAKSEFVSMVAHELKAPMGTIGGYAELLAFGKAGSVSQEQVSMLHTISTSVEHMASLVSDLADLSRIESGQLSLSRQPVPIADVVEDVVLAIGHQLEERQQQLTVQVADDLPEVMGDRLRLTQVLTNLVSNAYKYTPRGGSVTIRAEKTDGESGQQEAVRVSISDTGVGISPNDQKRIFQKFFRADDQRVSRVPGTGLGLSIARYLVEMQGGRIWFESEYGSGTTFHFTVPCAKEGLPDSAGQTPDVL